MDWSNIVPGRYVLGQFMLFFLVLTTQNLSSNLGLCEHLPNPDTVLAKTYFNYCSLFFLCVQ